VSSVGINRQQQKRMDSIFDANRSAIVSSYKTFLKAQANLDALNKATHPDQAQVFSAIDAVNQARASLQKAASAMLLQIRGEMTSEQVEKLESLK
jgi:Spy/CpxP family protein refolding chaperone